VIDNSHASEQKQIEVNVALIVLHDVTDNRFLRSNIEPLKHLDVLGHFLSRD